MEGVMIWIVYFQISASNVNKCHILILTRVNLWTIDDDTYIYIGSTMWLLNIYSMFSSIKLGWLQ